VVVEAAPKSGSLITARYAAEFGREVMAVPGSPLDPRAQGCNALIREGAVLVQSAADVVELMSGFDGAPRSSLREAASDWHGAEEAAGDLAQASADVAGLLTLAPVAVDEIIRQSGEPAPSVQLALLELELQGRLVRHAGGKVSLAA
jgi:DNA processing protein